MVRLQVVLGRQNVAKSLAHDTQHHQPCRTNYTLRAFGKGHGGSIIKNGKKCFHCHVVGASSPATDHGQYKKTLVKVNYEYLERRVCLAQARRPAHVQTLATLPRQALQWRVQRESEALPPDDLFRAPIDVHLKCRYRITYSFHSRQLVYRHCKSEAGEASNLWEHTPTEGHFGDLFATTFWWATMWTTSL